MKEEIMDAEDFFGGSDGCEKSPIIRPSDCKVNSKGRDAFENRKILMVMKIEKSSREMAVKIIAERMEALRAKENARRNAHDLDFTK